MVEQPRGYDLPAPVPQPGSDAETLAQQEAKPNLVGWRVIATSTLNDQRVSGVLLPATSEGLPRLHADNDGDAPPMELDPAQWTITAEVGLADRRKTRRRIFCPKERLIYRYNELPAAQLATVTMLKHRRLRPAEGQKPIASYMMPRGYAELFAVADSVAMPPLPPSRQAAWDLARTCAHCKARADQPHGKGHDGQRYCEPCQEPAAERRWHAERAADRARAQAWARDVLDDSDALLVYFSGTWQNFDLRVETLSGQVVISASLWAGLNARRNAGRLGYGAAEELARFTDPEDVVDQVRQLAEHRLVECFFGLDGLERRMGEAGAEVTLPVREGDVFSPHWDGWVGERPRGGSVPYRSHPGVKRQQLPYESAEVLAYVRDGLLRMAGRPAPA